MLINSKECKISKSVLDKNDVQQLCTKKEIEAAIIECDDAFEFPVHERSYYDSFLEKLCKYSSFFVCKSVTIIGYVGIYMNDYNSCIAYITIIGVKKEYQNQNIGSRLLFYCEQEAQKKGFKKIRLEVRKNNTKAIRFYKKNLYKYLNEASENSFYMEKTI